MNNTKPTQPETIFVTETDHRRLLELLNAHAGRRDADVLDQLEDELGRAVVVPSEQIPPNVVTMNSRIVFEDDKGQRREVSLVFPRDAVGQAVGPRASGRRAARAFGRPDHRMASSRRTHDVLAHRLSALPAGGRRGSQPLVGTPRSAPAAATSAGCTRHASKWRDRHRRRPTLGARTNLRETTAASPAARAPNGRHGQQAHPNAGGLTTPRSTSAPGPSPSGARSCGVSTASPTSARAARVRSAPTRA